MVGVFVDVIGVVGGGNVICVRNNICGRGVVLISGKERSFLLTRHISNRIAKWHVSSTWA